MRRNASLALIPVTLMIVVVGCKSTDSKYQTTYMDNAALYEPTEPTSTYEPTPERTYTSPRTDTYTLSTDTSLSARSATYETPADPSYDEPRIHVVTKKDTLYSLARLYYNSASKWKDIYEANRTDIADPNKIYVGQKLIIP